MIARRAAALLACLGGAALAGEPASPPAATAATVASAAWMRAVPPGARTAAIYLTLHGGAAGIDVVSASAPVAATVELHTTRAEGSMQRMLRVPAFAVAAGATRALRPGGDHLMLIGLARPLRDGDRLSLILTLADGRTRRIDVPVLDLIATGPDGAAAEACCGAGP